MKIPFTTKVRKVFKGLDARDFQVLEFFWMTEEPASKYDAMKALPKIPRATLYRKVEKLRDKGFLRVVDKKEFERGTLKFSVELLDIKPMKGFLASLGCNTEAFEKLPETGSRLFEVLDPQLKYDFFDKLFDVLIEAKEDLTDKKVDLYFLFYQFISKRPDIAESFLRKIPPRLHAHGINTRIEFVKELIKFTKIMKKKFGKDF